MKEKRKKKKKQTWLAKTRDRVDNQSETKLAERNRVGMKRGSLPIYKIFLENKFLSCQG